VIELLLQAERTLAMGLVDQAERMYRQAAEADPHSSIAVVGLARIALERADDAEAWRQAQRALAIDPENAAARRLVDRLEEVFRHRGQALPEDNAPAEDIAPAEDVAVPAAPGAPVTPPTATPSTPIEPSADRPARPEAAPSVAAPRRRGLLDRLRGRKPE
jgi:tetratricopeptide (TPR) repeat protein